METEKSVGPGAHWDVVVVGGGLAGLCAAIAARRGGASVRLLDNAPAAFRGGNARHARNFRVVHPEPTPYAPDSYRADEFLAELDGINGAPHRDLAERMVAGSEMLVPWLIANGVAMQPPALGVVPYSRRTVFPLGGGKAMVNALYRQAAALGIAISSGSEVRALRESENGGWIVEAADSAPGQSRIEACAVIVCAGGPGADAAWLRAHYGAAGDGLMVRGTPHADGRMLDHLIGLGARPVGDPTVCHMVAVDARGPRFDGGIVTRITAIPFGMVVDHAGARIDAVGAGQKPTHYARWGPRIAACREQTAYLILDADGLQRAAPQAFRPIVADSLSALGTILELDPATLEQSVASFNAAPPGNTTPLMRSPFAAYPMRAGITFVHHGVAVDDRLRVMWTDGRPRDGLYAAGMIMAANVLRRGYLAGLGITLSAVFGRLAGEEAARHVAG